MKKVILILIIFSFLAVSFVSSAEKSDSDYFEECAEKYGWTLSEFKNPRSKFSANEDPVEYYATFFKILRCFEATRGRSENGPCWFVWRTVANVGLRFNYDVYKDCIYLTNCYEESRPCNHKCWELPGDEYTACAHACTINVEYPCQRRVAMACEREFESKVMAWAATLKTEAPEGKTQKPDKDKRVQNKGCDGGFSDGKCSLVENCQSCPQDCSCPGGMKCKLSGEANFRGCIATAPKIEKLLEEYKENQTKYQELRLYWKRMARLYRANLIKKMMKFVLFDVPAPTPMTVGDLIVDTVNKIQEEVFYKQKMSDEEILVAQRKYLDRLKEEMRPLILRNREIRNEISKLRD